MPQKFTSLLSSFFFLSIFLVVAQDSTAIANEYGAVPFSGYLADFIVDSTLDTVDKNPGDGICADSGGQCTLRAAIIETNALPYGQSIYVPAGHYILTLAGSNEDLSYSGDLDITDTLAIYGAGQDQTTINANQIDRVFHVMSQDICAAADPSVCSRSTVRLHGFTIQGGNAPYGGGIYHEYGDLYLAWVTLNANHSYEYHPCIESSGAAYLGYRHEFTMNLSQITNNTTVSTSPATHYGAISGYTYGWSDVLIDQNDADWAFILPSHVDQPQCADSDLYRAYSDIVERVSITNTTGGAIYGRYPYESPVFRQMTISNNGTGVRLSNSTLSSLVTGGFSDVTIASNDLVGFELIRFLGVISRVVIADNGTNCVGEYYGSGVVDDDSCSALSASNFVIADPQLAPLIAGEYQYYHSTAPGSPAEGSGDYGPPTFTPRRLQTVDVVPSAHYYSISHLQLDNRIADQLIVRFEGEPYNPPGDSDPADVTNPANYRLFLPGPDGSIQTDSCTVIVGDDITVPIEQLTYYPTYLPARYLQDAKNTDLGTTVILNFDEAAVGGTINRLPAAGYRLLVCNNLQTINSGAFDGRSDTSLGTENSDAIYDFSVQPLDYAQVQHAGVEYADGTRWPLFASQVYPYDPPYVEVIPLNYRPIIRPDIRYFELQFNMFMDALEIKNTDSNFNLVASGPDGVISTQTCGNASGDDIRIPFTNARVGHEVVLDPFLPEDYFILEEPPFHYANLYVPPNLPAGQLYAFIMCDTVHEIEGSVLNGDFDASPGGNYVDEFYVMPTSSQLAPQLNSISDSIAALDLPNINLPEDVYYQVERTANGVTSIIGDVPLPQHRFVDSGLPCDTPIQYRLRFVRPGPLYVHPDDYFGPWSDPLSTHTLTCNNTLQHTFALYRDSQWLFYEVDGLIRHDVRFDYGPTDPDWVPLVGDWNGNGQSGIGLYKNGQFMLRDLVAGVAQDMTFGFGPATGATPIVGDWDGNGTDTIGIFDNGTFLLRNSNTAGPADWSFALGNPASYPIAGDWDGDGTDSVGYLDDNTFYLATSGSTPNISTSFDFGPSNWLPVIGDWNRDGVDTIGLYDAGLWRLRNSNIAGQVDYGFNYGDLSAGWQPISFDGDLSTLNQLFAATVPTPRVTSIPGPDLTVAPSLTPSATPTVDACNLANVELEFINFDPHADVRFRITNNRAVVANIVDFYITWPNNIWGLDRVVVGGNSVDDVEPGGSGLLIWQGLNGRDVYPPTGGLNAGDGTWLTDYTIPPNSSVDIHLDFVLTDYPLDHYGFTSVIFNSSWFKVSCGSDVNGDGNMGSDQPVDQLVFYSDPPYTPSMLPSPTPTITSPTTNANSSMPIPSATSLPSTTPDSTLYPTVTLVGVSSTAPTEPSQVSD